MNPEKPKIFLSYAHEDIGMAKRIYQHLKRYGLDIWFDNENLLPGQSWEVEIQKAIETSVYFLALFSSKSVDHIGYAQKELKLALDKLDLYPEGGIYIIPVRIDNCKIAHTKIKKIHWIDAFPESEYDIGIKKILEVVSPGANVLRKQPEELSEGDAAEMIRKYGFYDKFKNPEGKGFLNNYECQIITGNEVICDKTTGLMWYSGSTEYEYFENAKVWIEKLNQKGHADFRDWRLPTLEEAMSLMKPKRKDGLFFYFDPLFIRTFKSHIWTSDRVKGSDNGVWGVGFYYGYCAPSDSNMGFSICYIQAIR